MTTLKFLLSKYISKTGNNLFDTFLLNSQIPILSTESLDEAKAFIASNPKRSIIGTHSGCFHSDEVLACILLKYTNNFQQSIILRTRSDEILSMANVTVDVGGVFDPEKNLFDHHQKSFNEVFESTHKTKMSSAGLVYKFFGEEILSNIDKVWYLTNSKPDMLKTIYDKIYFNFIEAVDAVDNGISQYASSQVKQYLNLTNLSQRVARLNPYWTDEVQDQTAQFAIALDLIEEEFLFQLYGISESWLTAFSIVKEAFDSRLEVDKTGQIVVLKTGCPWVDHLLNLEEEEKKEGEVKFGIYPVDGAKWMIKTIPLRQGSFEYRVGLMKEWRGVAQAELAIKSGIEDITFVHNSGFIGGAGSLESCIKMARISLEEHK